MLSRSVIRDNCVTHYTLPVQPITGGSWNHSHVEKSLTSPNQRYAKNLKRLIELHEMTVAQVAEKAKLVPKQVYNLLNASHDPRLKGLEKVAAVFGLSAWQMLAVDLDEKPGDAKQILRLLELFSATDGSGRHTILQVADIASTKPTKGI